MKVLDTNTLTHLFEGHPRVVQRFEQETEEVATTIITRIEILEGRFAMLRKAANGNELRRAQEWLDRTVEQLEDFANATPIDRAAADEFDRLRANKKLKKIGRADLLIASIALANRATVVTRNVKDFRQVPGLHGENWVD
jgi:tRNA(fMet)-specific endonuclease VapC